MDIFTEIKLSVSLEEAASFYGINYNNNKMCCCLFHKDRHPSMKFNKDYYYCFSCGAHGDVINLVQQLYNLSPINAAKKICLDFNLNPKSDSYSSSSIVKERQKEIEHKKESSRRLTIN